MCGGTHICVIESKGDKTLLSMWHLNTSSSPGQGQRKVQPKYGGRELRTLCEGVEVEAEAREGGTICDLGTPSIQTLVSLCKAPAFTPGCSHQGPSCC